MVKEERKIIKEIRLIQIGEGFLELVGESLKLANHYAKKTYSEHFKNKNAACIVEGKNGFWQVKVLLYEPLKDSKNDPEDLVPKK